MSNKKVVGLEYKDEYKRKHRSKFLSDDVETKQRFGVFKVTEIFKPEHKEYFMSLYPHDDNILNQYPLPEDKRDATKMASVVGQAKKNLKTEKEQKQIKEEEKEGDLSLEQENEILESQGDKEKNKTEQIIKEKFIKIFDPKIQREEMKELEVELYVKKGSKTKLVSSSLYIETLLQLNSYSVKKWTIQPNIYFLHMT